MAYKKPEKNKEHAYKTFDQDLKADRLQNVMLLHGRENYLVNWAIDALSDKYVNPACKDFDYVKFNGATASFEEIRNSCETVPMFSTKKIVVVDKLKCLETDSEDEQKWADYFKQAPDTCLLVLTTDKADGRRKLYKTLLGCAGIYQFEELDEPFLKKFIEKRLKAAGKTAKTAVINELIAESGYFDKNTDYTLYNLENDMIKIIAHADGDEIHREDIIQGISGNIERDVFAMMDAIGHDRKAAAFKMLSSLALYNESEYKILGLLCSQFEAVTMVKEMKEDGKKLSEIAGQLGMHEYRTRLMMGLSDRYSLQQLKRILRKAYQVDRNIKSGMLDKNLALECFVASI